jgi:hypothetical protein
VFNIVSFSSLLQLSLTVYVISITDLFLSVNPYFNFISSYFAIDSDNVGACIAVVIYNLNLSSSIYVISIADSFLAVNTYFHLLLYYMFIYHLRSTNAANAFKTYVLIITVFPSSVNTYFRLIALRYMLNN